MLQRNKHHLIFAVLYGATLLPLSLQAQAPAAGEEPVTAPVPPAPATEPVPAEKPVETPPAAPAPEDSGAPVPAGNQAPPRQPAPAPVPAAGSDSVSDDFPPFHDSIIPGLEKSEEGSRSEETESDEGGEAVSADGSDESPGFFERLRENLGSDRTIINILILLGLFVMYLLYRKRLKKNRRSYS